MSTKAYENIIVEKEDGITWVILNRPEKRNAMSPELHYDPSSITTWRTRSPGSRSTPTSGWW